MATRRILRIDNAEDRKILKARSRPVQLPNPAIRQLAHEMFAMMHEANGIGLAAPQIGIPQRMAVIWIPPEVEEYDDGTKVEVAPEQHFVIINPEIIKFSDKEEIGQEGCLSMPGWYGDVPRPEWVTVEFTDLDGKRRRLRRVGDLLGRALQHEIDHLNGIMFTERMRDLSTLQEIKPEDEEKQNGKKSV